MSDSPSKAWTDWFKLQCWFRFGTRWPAKRKAKSWFGDPRDFEKPKGK